jgi:murein L,D-transpeptidase YafK
MLPLLAGFSDGQKIREIERKLRKNNQIVGKTRLIIDKSDYLIRSYDEKGLVARYPVVFGAEPDRDKFKTGDRRTPEGKFIIQSVRKHKKWHVMMMLDYPNEASLKKFERRKREGKVKLTDEPGGAIGIHGTWPHDDRLIDEYKNWTDGCISLKNTHIDDLKKYIAPGTIVEIEK